MCMSCGILYSPMWIRHLSLMGEHPSALSGHDCKRVYVHEEALTIGFLLNFVTRSSYVSIDSHEYFFVYGEMIVQSMRWWIIPRKNNSTWCMASTCTWISEPSLILCLSDICRLLQLQRLAFSKSHHFDWDIFPVSNYHSLWQLDRQSNSNTIIYK